MLGAYRINVIGSAHIYQSVGDKETLKAWIKRDEDAEDRAPWRRRLGAVTAGGNGSQESSLARTYTLQSRDFISAAARLRESRRMQRHSVFRGGGGGGGERPR